MCGVPIRLAFFLANKHVVMVEDEYTDSKEEYRLKACVWCASQTSGNNLLLGRRMV